MVEAVQASVESKDSGCRGRGMQQVRALWVSGVVFRGCEDSIPSAKILFGD